MEELTTNVEGEEAAMKGVDAPVEAEDVPVETEDPALEPIRKAAESVVGSVIRDAVYIIRHLQKKEAVPGIKYPVPNIKWMSCKDFTVLEGLAQIEDYMKTWELHESWLHWTNYINEEELEYSTRYFYRVRWSIPTCRKPIPRATACVYFIIEISKIRPSNASRHFNTCPEARFPGLLACRGLEEAATVNCINRNMRHYLLKYSFWWRQINYFTGQESLDSKKNGSKT